MKLEEFKNPGKEFRGAPFWSLNDLLEDDELTRQIAEMDDKGWGGFFLHAREGLETPYLSEEWMQRMETCVKEAEKRGMGAWLYDEDRWPSGFAGGIVPALGPEYRAKSLMLYICDRLDEVREAIKIFSCEMKDGVPVNIEPLRKGESGEDGKTYLFFVEYTAPVGEAWFNNFAYIDTLSYEAVKEFIKCTYEAYYERLGKWFGTAIPGIFTDEPNFSSSRPGGQRILARGGKYPAFFIPWTTRFPEYFKERNGYDILDHLPSLFFDVGDYYKVRYDFWSTITDLFLEAYSKQIYEWCDRHNLKYTGHYLSEQSLLAQLKTIGAAMPHYEYMHVPGVDHLGRNIDELLTMKQVASVANQLGRERVLCETYGCSGQNLSFEDRKWIGDWEYVLGVNLLNHHLSLYTMRGKRKRDYPPNLFWQQPWWKYNRLIADYFARLSYALSRGKRIVDILVIHTIGSAWAVYTPLKESRVVELDQALKRVMESLMALKWDFELGDEKIMARHGSVEGSQLRVGRCLYKAVIIPPAVTLAGTTVKLLKRFVENGGLLIAFKPLPTMIDGVRNPELARLFDKAVVLDQVKDGLLENALKPVARRVIVLDEEDRIIPEIWYHLREEGGRLILFLANISRDRDYKATVKIMGYGRLEEWDPFTGEVKTLPCCVEDGYLTVKLRFPPVGSHLLVVDMGSEPELGEAEVGEVSGEVIELEGEWEVERLDYNALTLDYCRVRLHGDGIYGGGSETRELVPTWRAHRMVMGSGVGSRFSLTYEFNVVEKPEGRVLLAIETPERFEISVNGARVKYSGKGYWVDTSFKTIDISELVKEGVNTIEVSGVARLDTEIESCYVVGEFAVENIDNREFRIRRERKTCELGDFVYKGYPFYPGSLRLVKKFSLGREPGRAVLRFKGLSAVVTEVFVNGKRAGVLFMRPHELDVSGLLRKGENVLELVLTSSLRNLLGPHHHRAGELFSVGPGSFMSEWVDRYCFVPFGLEKVELVLE